MRRLICPVTVLALLGLLSTTAFGQPKKEAAPKKEEYKAPPAQPVRAAPSYQHLDGCDLVFVVNGAGGSTVASDNLINVSAEHHLGLKIQMVPWCRHNALFQDLVDCEAQLNAADKIACAVTVIRKDAPNAHIFIVGHSAGAHVALAAADMLPPQSLDRVIVLHPAVSQTYDLTRVLKATKYGVDNFYSSEDGVLDTGNSHYRNADGGPGHAAGKHGFVCVSSDKQVRDLYCNVRQYRWDVNLAGSGGHYAWTRYHNLRKCVAPVFFTIPEVVVATPAAEKKKMSIAQ